MFLIVAVVVVVLVVVDIALVAVALGRSAPSDNGRLGPIPTYSSVPSPPASATPTTPVTPTPAATGAASGAAAVTGTLRHLAVVSATEAWRTVSGSCSGSAPTLEHTTNGGATWTTVAITKVAVDSITALSANSDRVSVVAGVGPGCDATGLSSYTSGRFWATDASPNAGASISPSGSLVLSGGTVASPCSNPVQVVQGATATGVVCPKGLAWRSGTGPWAIVPLSGLRGIAIDGASYTLARTGVAGCSGVQMSRLAAASVTAMAKPTPVGCAPITGSAGSIGLGVDASSVWVWSGDRTLVSADGGATW